ncbi:MAG: TlpA family protein disulfide reductase [Acidimicrobiales bacterium]
MFEPVPRPRRWLIITVGAAVLVPLVIVLWSRIGTDPRFVESPLLNRPAPEWELPRIDAAGTLSTDDLDGTIYVVNFWASWCVPCRRENASLDSFYRRWQDRGVALVGILYADDEDSALAFREELGGSWPLVNDPDGRIALEFGVAGVPETFVIDSRGVVMAKLIGAVGPTTLDDVIEQISGGGPAVTAENDDYRQGPGR